MDATLATAGAWEAAWEEYVEALAKWEADRPYRFRRGNVRAHRKLARRLVEAKGNLRELDAEFCERLGI